MLIAPKQRGTVADPFPTPGMSGGEIEVIGYRGMKEYEIGFDDFRVPSRQPAGRRRGAGLQAADGDVRKRPHPDGGARDRRGAGGARHRPRPTRSTASSSGVRSSTSRASPTSWR
jgi:hypothetical protein